MGKYNVHRGRFTNERFKALRKYLGYTQEKMGEILGITKAGVSLIETGANSLSDRHIKMLSVTLGVSEEWFKTGDGDMFCGDARQKEIGAFIGKTLDSDEEFKKRFIVMLSCLTVNEWKLLEKMASLLAQERQTENNKECSVLQTQQEV